MAQRVVAFETAEEHFLVVAGQNAHTAALGPFARGGDDARAVGPAIDEIAEEDDSGIRRGAADLVRLDPRDHPAQQVVPAMDVSDGVDSLALRHRRDHLGDGTRF